MLYAVLRIRGKIGTRKDIEDTMRLLKLTRVNHCVVYNDSPKISGMLRKAKDYITWGEISKDVFLTMVFKRGFLTKEDGKVVGISEVYKEKKDLDKIISEVFEGKSKLDNFSIKPLFRLKPPTKGFERKGVKKSFAQGGVLGYRGADIDRVLKKMI